MRRWSSHLVHALTCSVCRAFQGQREEAAKELAIAHKERAEVETTAATLQEEVEVIHKALVEEQHKAEQLDNRLSGVTEYARFR